MKEEIMADISLEQATEKHVFVTNVRELSGYALSETELSAVITSLTVAYLVKCMLGFSKSRQTGEG